jgi:ribosome-associated heat shock protein Hsp15
LTTSVAPTAAPGTSPGATDNPPAGAVTPERAKGRLDQWLWFARFVKTRSLGARLCAAGAASINGVPARKANQGVRVGDVVVVPQGGWQLTVRVLALGARRGPAVEARTLYEEFAAPVRLRAASPVWTPLLLGDDGAATDGATLPASSPDA